MSYVLKIMLNPSNQYNNVDVYGVSEAARMRILANLIKDKLKKSDYSNSIDCIITPADASDNLNAVVELEHNYKPHIFLSPHLNGANGNASGTECWYYNGDAFGKRVASRLSASVASLIGITDRGAKVTLDAPEGGIFVVDNTNSTGMLIECCFQDRKGDVDRFLASQDKVANQIAWILIDECMKQFGLLTKNPTPQPQPSPAKNAQALKYIAEIEKNTSLLKAEVQKWL